MKTILFKSLLAVALMVFVGNTSFAQHKYIGAAKCKMCHNNPAKGEQYNKWFAGPHAKAYNVLSEEEKKNEQCLKCHSTAALYSSLSMPTIKNEEGVSCEACHGPGSTYKSMAIMKSHEQSLKNGLIVPDEALCLTCHNEESPHFKGFDYASYLERIAHPNPSK